MLLLMGMFLISFTSASLGVFKQSDCIQLYQFCDDCTYVNVTTVQYPDGTIETLNKAMEKNDVDYNYTFCDTTNLGTHYYIVKGDKAGATTTERLEFEITPLGTSQSTSQGIGSFGYLFLMIALMFVFGYMSFKFFNTENWWIMGILFGFISLTLLVYNSWLGYEYRNILTGLPSSNIPETLFWILLFILVLGSLTCVVLLFRHWRKIFKYMKKEIKRKEPNDEDVEDWDVDRWAGENWKVER